MGLSEYFASGSDTQISQKFWDSVSVDAVADRIGSREFYCLVAGGPNDLSGYAALRNRSHLFHLFVAKHSQSQGLGKQLRQEVLAHFGNSEITVNSSLFAVPFYQRLGFTRVGLDKSEDGITYAPMVFKNDS